MSGKLIGVGLGPGDPELLTLKAIRFIQQAPVLAYTVDAKGSSFARQIAAAHIRQGQVELPLLFSMSHQRSERQQTRQDAARQVLEMLEQEQDVVFITEGDPLLYSTFQHLLAELPPRIEIFICPGVSSLTASAAAAHVPLVVEQENMVIAATNQETSRQIASWLQQFDRIVLFKVHRHLAELHNALAESGLLSQAVLVQHASLDGQTVVCNLAEWDGSTPPYFSILLIRSRRPA